MSKQCKCEHWQQCPICMPHRFDANGNLLPPEPTPLQAARNRIEELERDVAFAMSKCECKNDDDCRNLAKLHEPVSSRCDCGKQNISLKELATFEKEIELLTEVMDAERNKQKILLEDIIKCWNGSTDREDMLRALITIERKAIKSLK